MCNHMDNLWGEGWVQQRTFLLRRNIFLHDYSVLFHEIWQKHGLVDDGVAFVWPQRVWIFVLCCDLAKLENIIMTLNLLFSVGLPWLNKGHCLCKWFFIPRFYFLNIRNIRGKKKKFPIFRTVKVLIELTPPLRLSKKFSASISSRINEK